MKRNWLCGIDLGSHKISGVIGRVEGETLSHLGAASVEAAGISKGVVTHLSEVASGVKSVVVEQTWEPGWSSNRLTAEGRRKLGLGQ